MATFARGIPVRDRALASKAVRMEANIQVEVVTENPAFASKLPGDGLALRGIPAIGRGVSGAIRFTSPESAAVR